MRTENLPYLAKLEEDPYARTLLEEIQDMLTKVDLQILTKHYDLQPHQIYSMLGYQKALNEVLLIPTEARMELTALPEA